MKISNKKKEIYYISHFLHTFWECIQLKIKTHAASGRNLFKFTKFKNKQESKQTILEKKESDAIWGAERERHENHHKHQRKNTNR